MGKRIGIVGGGQLGRMLTQAAHKLGFVVCVLDSTPNSPAGQIAEEQILGDVKDGNSIRKLAKQSDFLTVENEWSNAEALKELAASGVSVSPSADTLEIIRDKLRQKQFLYESGIPITEFKQVESRKEIGEAAKKFAYPLLLKARFDAYDGRGNALVKSEDDIDAAMVKLSGRQLYVEKFVPFQKELSVVVARAATGEVKAYPVVETIHLNNILHTLIAPARVDDSSKAAAQQVAEKVLTQLKGVGVFGIEMFLTQTGEVLVNEIAPRVHNSGHHTIEACQTSQFEQHVRAITGMELGPAGLVAPAAVMLNILGERTGMAEERGVEKAQEIPGISVHIYGKMEVRPERKMGHITALADSVDEALERANQAKKLISI